MSLQTETYSLQPSRPAFPCRSVATSASKRRGHASQCPRLFVTPPPRAWQGAIRGAAAPRRPTQKPRTLGSMTALQIRRSPRGSRYLLLISLASPNTVLCPSFAFLAKGGTLKWRRQVGSITCPQQIQIAHAASPPTPSTSSGQTLAKSAGMVHPQWERCTQRSLKVYSPGASFYVLRLLQ